VNSYPIRGGIPRFVGHADYAKSFGYQWNAFKREQLDSYSGLPLSEDRFRNETGWSDDWMAGKWILDAGCGAGRFLEIALRSSARIIGVDISNAVDAAAESLGQHTHLHLIQADLFHLPIRPASMDAVYSIGVIQHTPDPERAIDSLVAILRPGGRLALTMYERKPWTMLHSKYWLRRITTRIPQRALMSAIRALMPVLFPATEVLFRIPYLNTIARFAIPVANYVDSGLPLRARYRWSLLDTFDMLAPTYDIPQRAFDLIHHLELCGMRDIFRTPHRSLNLIGIREDSRPAPARLASS
jgi:SAM-dependent methyltransferase